MNRKSEPDEDQCVTMCLEVNEEQAGNEKLTCFNCNKIGMRSCPQLACINCCNDEKCPAHQSGRLMRKQMTDLLEGNNEITKLAAEKRQNAVRNGIFHFEPALLYMQETLVCWSLQKYFENPKLRDDALRKSDRRRDQLVRSRKFRSKPKLSRRKKFDMVLNSLYEKSLKSNDS